MFNELHIGERIESKRIKVILDYSAKQTRGGSIDWIFITIRLRYFYVRIDDCRFLFHL